MNIFLKNLGFGGYLQMINANPYRVIPVFQGTGLYKRIRIALTIINMPISSVINFYFFQSEGGGGQYFFTPCILYNDCLVLIETN